MGRNCLLALVLLAGSAAAQPVSYQLAGDVTVGHKPALRISAAQPVRAVRLELDRDDGKHFTVRHPALAKGQTVTLTIGDGAAGKSSYKGTLSVQVAGAGTWSGELTFETLVRAPIKVTYDADHLDLDKRVLQFKLSRPAASATLSVIGEDGKPLGTGTATYARSDPDRWLSITWTQRAATPVMMMKLRVVAADGLATNVELIPWSVAIDHEDVSFRVDSSVIDRSEEAKLDASLTRIAEVGKRAGRFMKLKLYVAGHTDTVGSNPKNRKLSLARARAIATYFRRKGVTLPIVYAGFGEEVLKVRTADNTDERANRRADYVLGPVAGAAPFKGAYRKVRASWQPLR